MKMNVSSMLKVGQIDYHEDERSALRAAFLEREGLGGACLMPLPVDASKRCYFRFSNGLLMDAPPPYESTFSFHRIAECLRDAGLSVPQIYASNHEDGFLFIEDFGELTFRKALEKGVSDEMLYREAIRSLIHLHQQLTENNGDIPSYSLALFLREAELFLEWYGLSFSVQEREDFKGLWTEAYHHQPSLPHSLVMRDVMVDNLLWIPSREGFKRCGFIDFQDGVWGPITYDLVSLLEDARRDITPQFGKEMLAFYLEAFPDLSQQDLWESYTLWGAQRCTKILGIFSRLAKRDGKSRYLAHLPRVKSILERDLSHPSLKTLQNWYKKVGLR